MDKIKLATGVLTWPQGERVSDRYGSIGLLASPDSEAYLPLPGEFAGISGRLAAHVVETRQSRHIGDFFRGVYPSTPAAGDWIDLGRGEYFRSADCSGPVVGLRPADGRSVDWLDIHALYRCHEQTVDLYFEPDGAVPEVP